MTLGVGSRIGVYEVVGLLGSGGMGEVYKARDSRLGRTVAIKVLNPDRSYDANARMRFVQEAQAASALSHPNIVSVFDWIDADGLNALVMELVEGSTLDRRIPAGGMSVSEALKYAVPIADALSAAHAAHIVHRDIKPGNLIVTDRGHVKVLDFGLAKLRERATAQASDATVTVRAISTEGTVVGTAAYMSPEQAEGKPVDARTDIFAFGAVLYEMLTGQRAFQGNSTASTMAAVLKESPRPLTQLAAGVPHELEKIVNRCLRKDADRRSQSMAEIKLALEELKEESESGASAAVPANQRRRTPALAVAALVVVAAVVAGFIAWSRFGRQAAPVYRVRQVTRDAGLTIDPALSPDGKLLAYSSDRGGASLDIWVQQVAGSGEPLRLTRHPGDARQAVFSPDGSSIVFQRDDKLYSVPVLGGAERFIANGIHPNISPDGRYLASSSSYTGSPKTWGIWITPLTGGPSEKINTDEKFYERPLWSPSGRFVLASVNEAPLGSAIGWHLLPVAGGNSVLVAPVELFRRAGVVFTRPRAWLNHPSRVVFDGETSGGVENVWQLRIDESSGRAIGDPVQLTRGTGEVPGQPSAAAVIPFATASASTAVYSIALDAASGQSSGPVTLVLRSGQNVFFPCTTPDGKTLIYASDRLGSMDIWKRDLITGIDSILVSTPAFEYRGFLSPDGAKLVFVRSENDRSSAYLYPLPNGPEQRICDNCRSVLSFTPDSTGVLLSEGIPERLVVQDLATGKRVTPASHPRFAVHDGRLSPDGTLYAFKLVMATNDQPVFVTRFQPAGSPEANWIKISDGSFNAKPFWSFDGRLLYFFSRRDGAMCLYVRKLETGTGRPIGEILPVRHFHDKLRLSDRAVHIGYGLAPGRLYVPLSEAVSNIWLAEPGP